MLCSQSRDVTVTLLLSQKYSKLLSNKLIMLLRFVYIIGNRRRKQKIAEESVLCMLDIMIKVSFFVLP